MIHRIAWIVALGIVGLAGCEGSPTPGGGGEDVEDLGDAEPEAPDAAEDDGRDLGYDLFAVTSVRPGHGPFQGGTLVRVRGRGFAEGAVVFFGDHMAQPADTGVVNDNEIVTVTPAGEVGPVDVRVVQRDDEALLPDGFNYEAIAVSPGAGSIAGGTFVTIVGSGTAFAPGDSVLFGRRPAEEVDVVSATVITCRTPPGAPGPVHVTVRTPSGDITAREAFLYFSTVDPINGGLGGGPIDGSPMPGVLCPEAGDGSKAGFKSGGTVNVTVLDSMTGAPVPGAFVILGISGSTPHQGLTDARGMIVFSGPDLSGRQTITAAKERYETTTVEHFDATNVTIFLVPIVEPEPGPMPPGRYGATIAGEVIVESTPEFACQPWDLVPDPIPGTEQKVVYLFATSWDIWSPPPPPTYGGARARIVEGDAMGSRGYRYSVFARPGALAVIALAGIERIADGAFTPYGMGVARHIVAGPGERVEGIEICVTHPMDVSLRIELVDPPLVETAGAPNTYRIDVFLDLGGDGVFWSPLRSRYVTDAAVPLVFPGWVSPNGDLADATYVVVAGAYNRTVDALGMTGDFNPFSVVISSGHRNVFDPIVVDRFIGIPRAVDPTFGAVVRGSRMSFTHALTAPDFWLVMLQTYPDQAPLWRIILPGCRTSYELPDIAALAGLPELPAGYSLWIVYGIRAPGFVYDEWSYRFLSERFWSAYAADAFVFKFRE